MKKKFFLIFLITSISFQLEAKTIQIMSYNVENLFDTKHDEGKNDWSFLPKDTPGKKEECDKERGKFRKVECYNADWTNEKLENKLLQIVDVLTKERKTLPDFLGLIEVENKEVVERLAKKLGYENIEITNSPDKRGVDVALLYKSNKEIKKISRAEHVVPVDYPTRNILEVEFLIKDYPLTFFINHWPSLANPDSWRVKSAEVLAKRTKEILLANPKMNVIAMGDFNTIDRNDPHPFKTVLFKENLFFDSILQVKSELKKKLPEGSYYYPPKDEWSYLDHIFYTSLLQDGQDLEIDLSSFEIYLPSFALKEVKKRQGSDDEGDHKTIMIPKRFEMDAKTRDQMGFSDHFVVAVKLSYPEIKRKEKIKKKK